MHRSLQAKHSRKKKTAEAQLLTLNQGHAKTSAGTQEYSAQATTKKLGAPEIDRRKKKKNNHSTQYGNQPEVLHCPPSYHNRNRDIYGERERDFFFHI